MRLYTLQVPALSAASTLAAPVAALPPPPPTLTLVTALPPPSPTRSLAMQPLSESLSDTLPVPIAPPATTLRVASPLRTIPFCTLQRREDIGHGSFGQVSLAWWTAGGTTVAVKCNGVSCVDVAAIDNERAVLEIIAGAPHRHVLTVYGLCVDAPDGALRIVMDHCDGGGLDALLSQRSVEHCCCRSLHNVVHTLSHPRPHHFTM